MRLLIIAAAFLGVAILARESDGAEKAKRPTVCMSYAIAKTNKANDDAVAICYDGKKPALLYLFKEVEIPGADGKGPVRAVVGWR
jgi:hypothetical protein